jgi:peptidoglycan hydrolase-like protein with peptidoglycan-binding domain
MDWKSHFKELSNHKKFNTSFGSEPPETIKLAQAKLNALGFATPPLVVDGNAGPLTQAATKKFQNSKGLTADGIIGPQTLAALGIVVAPPKPGVGTGPTVKISTVVAALKQAAQEKGYTLSDQLAALMIGQLRGAEGAYPGVKSSLGGTNNFGAAQVTASLSSLKKGMAGWGAFAHKDSDPNKGDYIGWYWIAPSPLEGARHWFQDNWWGPRLAQNNPQNATDYAAILYSGGYYGGMHAGDTAHDPNSDAGKLNVADYAAAIQRGMPSAAELSTPPDDPAKVTVDPTQFQDLASRKLTETLYDKAMSGGIGSSWKYLLPATWDDFVKANGVVWFGPPPVNPTAAGTGLATGFLAIAGGIAALIYYFVIRKGV